MKELVLNPTENFYPLLTETHRIKGLYIPQVVRDKSARVIFAGRNKYTTEINRIYRNWEEKLKAGNITLALLSGLHASIILFMSIGTIGDKVMILSPDAGGHFATKNILSRLGYEVFEFPVDYENNCIDIEQSIIYANTIQPDFVFIARSNCMQYENFFWLNKIKNNPIKVFDASQYLTGILTKKYASPFSMDFDIIVSSLHKDFPGTQQAFCAFSQRAQKNGFDKIVMHEFSKYISNIHPSEIFASSYYIDNFESLMRYEDEKMENAKAIYYALKDMGISLQTKKFDFTATQQMWIKCSSQDTAYQMFKQLEFVGIMVNYMELPYRLGYGLRVGTGAATLQGLKPQNCNHLAKIIVECAKSLSEYRLQNLLKETQEFLDDFIKE